ncbi:DUF4883 family protein [Clostridium neuense]|uniref:DUF4883 family protein n=1 Tax=Clostridium neuense TaxID=1728934 RepID=A0ABW8TJC6_9CLOT
MKSIRFAKFSILIFICLTACGCSFSFNQKKPYIFYYTNELSKNFHTEKQIKASLIDTSYYKNHNLSSDEINDFYNFLSALRKHNYIKRPKDLPNKPLYRLFFTFSKNKYVLDVYNEKYASIYPWDGSYEKDFLNISDIPASINPYSLCKYAIPR